MLTARHAWAREFAQMLQLDKPIVGIDLETTGPFPDKDRIVQVGYVRIAVDGVVEEREIDVNPEREIPAEAIAVHGITNERAQLASTFAAIAPDLALATFDAYLCGYNVKFDAQFLWYEFKRANVEWRPARNELGNFVLVDAYKIFASKCPRDLSAAVEHFLGEAHENAHTALADAKAATRVVHAQLKAFGDLPRSPVELHTMFFETAPVGYVDPDRKLSLRDGKILINFGKAHIGKSIDLVPTSYLEWMISSDFNKPVKRACREELERRRNE